MHIHTHAYIHTYIHTYIHMHTYIHTNTDIYAGVHTQVLDRIIKFSASANSSIVLPNMYSKPSWRTLFREAGGVS